MRYVIYFILIALGLPAFAGAPARAAAAAALTNAEMQACWDDLLKPEPDCSRALLTLSASPEQAVTFLKAHLRPLKIEPAEVNQLLKDLESDDEEIWKPAYQKLKNFDPRLAIPLPTLMADVNHPVARARLVEILTDRPVGSLAGRSIQYREFEDGQNFIDGRSSFWAEKDISRLGGGGHPKAEWTRAARAIVLLEHIGSAGAVAILKDMATGHPDAGPTNTAVIALEHLDEGK
jgi:hypothetical protein